MRCFYTYALIMMLALSTSEGHSVLTEPPSRNWVAANDNTEYCPHCLMSGGPKLVKERANGHWPGNDVPISHGLCGDPKEGKVWQNSWREERYLKPTPVQRTYTAGDVVEFEVGVSTHHRGHYEFRLCDKALDGATMESREKGWECLTKHVLHRAPLKTSCTPDNKADADCQPIDEQNPGRWYLPPRGWTAKAGSQSDDGDDMQASKLPWPLQETHKMRYKIPDYLKCEHCTLQWYWATGNVCVSDGGYFSYFEKMAAAGWPSKEWSILSSSEWGLTCSQACCGSQNSGKYTMEFWNCADVAVHPPGQGPTPAPPTAPTPEPTTPGPTPAPPTVPTPEPTTPMSNACKAYCSKTNVAQTSLKVCHKVTDKNACLNNYMYKTRFNSGKVTPCRWSNKKRKCRPRRKQGITCPGFPDGCLAGLIEGRSQLVTAKATVAGHGDMPPLLAHSRGFLSQRFSSSKVTLGSWFMQNESKIGKHIASHPDIDAFSEEL